MATRSLARLGLPPPEPAPTSGRRGSPTARTSAIEIPSVEGPAVLRAVIEQRRGRGHHRQPRSQGSGAMLLTSPSCARWPLGADAGIEVSLFVGPREDFDVGAHARSADGAAHFGQVRGARPRYAVEDVARACEQGIRSFLVADLGLLELLTEMQRNGELPSTVWKSPR